MRKRTVWTAVAVAVAAGVVAAAATAGGGGAATKHPASLKHQLAALKAQNKHLNDAFSPPGIERQLAKTKAALDKYQSVAVAEADGYAPASPCESTSTDPDATWWGGGMGVHFMNQAAIADGKLIPTKPEVLTYLPTADGGFELLAAEYFQPDADQDVSTDADRPSLFGRAFDGPMQGHGPGMPIHYDLHVWLWKHNPSGLFAPWNPTVTCPAG